MADATADSPTAAGLTGAEAAELRRWLLGAEGGRSRARGLRRRIEELAGALDGSAGADLLTPLEAALQAARALPGIGWPSRLAEDSAAGRENATETFLRAARRQVMARAPQDEGLYGIECDLHPLAGDLAEAGEALARALESTMDRLAVDAMARDPGRFRPLLRGREGMGGIYERWRRLKAVARGRSFDPRHDPTVGDAYELGGAKNSQK